MAGNPSVAILRDIQTLFDVGTSAGLTDRQLLERFTNWRDASSDSAFEVLILRHGPMVLRVCRNLLRDEADVADAFQATFLVLVRKRETIRRLESVGGWLYGVACRVAARARVDAARRQRLSLKEYREFHWNVEFVEAEATRYKAESDLAAVLVAPEAEKKSKPGQLAREAALRALKAAAFREKGLVDYVQPRRIKELELAIAVAKTEEKASKARWDLESNKAKRLEREIQACKILAPRDGMVIHMEPLEEGAFIQPHHLLFKIVPVLVPEPGAQ